ncbi:hypothetical protein VVD49_14115 [Uliginosibacterium sp. H3]|uniref:Uncharacterized protein n=1 Tax=Uliginosibacterium silvisoli TaxID=3114758 RepID=A0ABU6K798_9RHOO|nr:hypothetical protein [Uliginosibacterium sp. H3]
MQALAKASARLFSQFFSSLFSLDDKGAARAVDPALIDDEQDENHPLAHSYFGA